MKSSEFCALIVSNKLTCSKRIIDECEKNIRRILQCKFEEADITFDRRVYDESKTFTHLIVQTDALTSVSEGVFFNTVENICTYCEGINDGVFGVLGSD